MVKKSMQTISIGSDEVIGCKGAAVHGHKGPIKCSPVQVEGAFITKVSSLIMNTN